jgi:competence protein ComEC
MTRRPLAVALAGLLALVAIPACGPAAQPAFPTPGAAVDPAPPPEGGAGSGEGQGADDRPAEAPAPAPRITWQRVESPDDVPRTPPPPGTYRIHMIDVGTGLSILVQGHDFALLYDAGSGDPGEHPLRVVAYLHAALGPSGGEACVAKGEAAPGVRRSLDHVVLSHPHLDHGSALDLVVHCYDVRHVWDSGRINDTVFYREILAAIAQSPTVRYATAADVPADRAVTVKGARFVIPRWERFAEGDQVRLGETARFTFLHADGKKKPDPNQNSVVIAVELGATRLLLVGDAESGPRKPPDSPPGDIELFLLDHHREAIAADILQVGHHGSMTSSRRAFLEAVKPKLALVSAGPKKYHKIVLPDREVIEELARVGAEILRTDTHDAACPLPRRIGPNKGPGGCDSYVITVAP